MTVERIDWLRLLHELCARQGWALLLTARHDTTGTVPFAGERHDRTALANLDVVDPERLELVETRQQALIAGELVARVDLETVDGNVYAAAELLVELLERQLRKEAA